MLRMPEQPLVIGLRQLAESGQGVGFNFNIGKKWAWAAVFFNEVRADNAQQILLE